MNLKDFSVLLYLIPFPSYSFLRLHFLDEMLSKQAVDYLIDIPFPSLNAKIALWEIMTVFMNYIRELV